MFFLVSAHGCATQNRHDSAAIVAMEVNILAYIGALDPSLKSNIDIYHSQDGGKWMHYRNCSIDSLYWSLSSGRSQVVADSDRHTVYPRVEVKCVTDESLNIVKIQSSICRKPDPEYITSICSKYESVYVNAGGRYYPDFERRLVAGTEYGGVPLD